MGLFGKKKTPEQYMEKGKGDMQGGFYALAASNFSKVKGELEAEALYQAGICYLMMDKKKHDKYNIPFASEYFEKSAKIGHKGSSAIISCGISADSDIDHLIDISRAAQTSGTELYAAGQVKSDAKEDKDILDFLEIEDEEKERAEKQAILAMPGGDDFLRGKEAVSQGINLYSNLMDAYAEKGQWDEAIACGKEAIEKGFNGQWYLMELFLKKKDYDQVLYWAKEYDKKVAGYQASKRLDGVRSSVLENADKADKEKDYKTKREQLQIAAALGSPEAMYQLGRMAEQGEGAALDFEEALEWYQKASNMGYSSANIRKGTIESVISQRDSLEKIAEITGSSKTIIELMKHGIEEEEQLTELEEKYFFEGNYKEALVPLRLLAERESRGALYLLGRMYAEGLGIDRDCSMAKDFYDKLTAQSVNNRYTIPFGTYPQGENGEVQPLHWFVLDREGDSLLLLSEKVIKKEPYHIADNRTTWVDCSLRHWLNHDFLQSAFTEKERQKLIKKADVINKGNKDFHTSGGSDTKDQIFLLSLEQAIKYFSKGDPERIEIGLLEDEGFCYYSTNCGEAKGLATKYAIKNKKQDADQEYSRWWLRTPGKSWERASYVDSKGVIEPSGRKVGDFDTGVRPALWLNLRTKIY
ncbi:DUF6273 domain-containing protein [Faecalicatena contorta]|uniref:DUF6273 domain-containing protein n=1 Tax=Faecalicatena contorta TaxID=39482 RepID=UPI001F32051A|nr:DUF6273 domain-containing protein [Faecalicatena contorta]MCF2669064.1 sel1 repeat family protein [Faecalicatena contorta]